LKLSCLPVSFFAEILDGRMTVPEWARMGRELGLDGIDISILFAPDRSPAAIAALRRAVADEGTRIVMVTTYPDFTHPDPAQRVRELALEQEAVEVAAGLGAELVRVTAGQAHPETSRANGIEWAADGLCRLQEWARGSGVTLAYENHAKPGVWQHTDFCQPPDVFLEIARRTEASGLGINFDVGNAAAYCDDPRALLEAVLPRIVSIHASDTATRGALQHVLLGTGVTPYAELFGRLVEAGWDGWVCMEEASRMGRDGVAAAAAFVRRAWEAAERAAVAAPALHGAGAGDAA
jgi:sugar phosphate isomerase/epimerase